MLKSLELFGFKSFADRTRFDFADGITCVVGPNGSGKSNVVDAIKWIMGDQSPKSLRGKEMTDVIFNGASGRSPSNFAEATLSFDNSTGLLPIDAAEVQIGRRLWRSGDSEYLINQGTARLKDIKDLFMGTGAGTSAYSIIEQGRVDQILQANASARRAVFEEAAGVSRYKSRRSEALRKLERVAQNLLRLTDIVDSLEAQRNATRSQAAKATKFREVAEDLRRQWLGLAADDYRLQSSVLKVSEAQLGELAAEIEVLNQQQDELECELTEFDAKISQVEDRLRSIEQSKSANRETMAGHEATIRHQISRRQELESELIRLRRQRTVLGGRFHEATEEFDRSQTQAEQFRNEFDKHKTGISSAEQQIQELAIKATEQRSEVESERQRQFDLMRGITESDHRVINLKSQRESIQKTAGELLVQLNMLEEDIATQRQETQRQQQQSAEAEQQASRIHAVLQQKQAEKDRLISEHSSFQNELTELLQQQTEWKTRLAILEDLERQQQGLGIGVKDILGRAQTSGKPPWNSIIGSVADLLEVDLEDAALLEVALADRSQLVVVDDVKPLADYLKRPAAQIDGRVGFVALNGAQLGASNETDVNEPHQMTTDLSDRPGVIGRADRRVRGAARTPHLAEQLLADTWIVSSLEAAFELSAGDGQDCRFVTLAGELLESNGTLFAGKMRAETALFSRKSELRRLKNDLMKQQNRIGDEEDRVAGLDDSIADAAKQLETAEREYRTSTDHISKRKIVLADSERQLQSLLSQLDDMNEELNRQCGREQQLHNEIEQAEMDLAESEESLRLLQTEIENSERDISRIEHRRQGLEKKQSTEQLTLAKQEERLTSLQTACQRLEVELNQRQDQRDEADRRFESTDSKMKRSTLQTLNTNAQLAELFLQDESLAADVALLESEKGQFRQQRIEIAEQESQLRKQRRDLNDKQHAEEIQARDIRHQMRSLDERIVEEYQLALADVVETGASALADYIAERDGETHQVAADIRFEDVRDELESRVSRLRRKMKTMGNVNTDSLDDLEELETRYGHFSEQLQDLVEAKATLEEIVRRINTESQRLFHESFSSIRTHFQELFRKLFGGGEGDVILEDPEDVLECNIDIVARPPGKELRSISLLSGGEKTMTAVALLMAMFQSRPSPFCILDEVDAALDEANVDRYTAVVKEFEQTTQFIMITHNKRSMTIADVMYGVTMEQSGVSKRLSVRFEDVNEDGDFNVPPQGSQNVNDAA